MLVLTRKENESIRIGDDIFLHLLRIQGDKVRIGIEAPNHVNVIRTELLKRDAAEDGTTDNTESSEQIASTTDH